MNSLVDKFKDICTKKITLPDGGEITISKLNVEFQSKLYKDIELSENDYMAALRYISYVNNHICSQYRDYNFTYKDKLYLLNYWLSDINSNPVEEIDFKYQFKSIGNSSVHHPNTIKLLLTKGEKKVEVVGESLGGGVINIAEVDGFVANFSAQMLLLI